MRLEPAGAEALLLVLAEQPDACLPLRIAHLAETLRERLGPLLRDLVPGWTTLLLHYDLMRIDHLQLCALVTPILEQWMAAPAPAQRGRLHEIPVWYAGADLAWVAERCALRVDEVIELHSACEYRVGAIGFAPGFAYLGELDARLALPRRATPRVAVPAGSLAIAERQTAVYPQASPGGWHLLGHCALSLFDVQREPPCPLQVGDRVRFLPVDETAWRAAGGRP
jgi:KipI family sensor histidine kinase inhibitor